MSDLQSRIKAKLCPCGCGTLPPLNDKGKRPMMCAKAWASMPANLRSDFLRAGDSDENRRAAAGQMLRILQQRLGRGESGAQLVFEL
jgi:hypothetical protein